MSRAVLSVGSNLGDRSAHLASVLDALGDRLVRCSSVYVTAPWGGVDQDDFLNVTLIADDDRLDARGWLRFGQDLEQRAGRVRLQRWGPRSLDVDVISCTDPNSGGEVRSDDPELTLPHPRAAERAFVLVPWLEIEPDGRLGGVALVDLVRQLDPDERAGVRHIDARPGGGNG